MWGVPSYLGCRERRQGLYEVGRVSLVTVPLECAVPGFWVPHIPWHPAVAAAGS